MDRTRMIFTAIRRGTESPLARAYDLVNDPSTDSIISWTENGESFIIWNPKELSGDVLYKFMSFRLFSDFTRKLETLGIKKVEGCEKLEYADEYFVRGKPELLNRIFERISVEINVKNGIRSREEVIEYYRKLEVKGWITMRPKEGEEEEFNRLKTKIRKKIDRYNNKAVAKINKRKKKAVAKELADQLKQQLRI